MQDGLTLTPQPDDDAGRSPSPSLQLKLHSSPVSSFWSIAGPKV